MWEAIAYVSSGLSLVAFLGAIAYRAFRTSSRRSEELIRTAPEETRADLVRAALRHFRVASENWSEEAQLKIALDQLEKEESALTIKWKAVCFLAVICAIVAVVAILSAKQDKTDQSSAREVHAAASAASSATAMTAQQSPLQAPVPVAEASAPIAASAPTAEPARASVPTAIPASTPAASQVSTPGLDAGNSASAAAKRSKSSAKSSSASPAKNNKTAAVAADNPDVAPTARPGVKLTVILSVAWQDEEEGAMPKITGLNGFTCAPFRLEPATLSVVRKTKLCTRQITDDGRSNILFEAVNGPVWVSAMAAVRNRVIYRTLDHEIERGAKRTEAVVWKIDTPPAYPPKE